MIDQQLSTVLDIYTTLDEDDLVLIAREAAQRAQPDQATPTESEAHMQQHFAIKSKGKSINMFTVSQWVQGSFDTKLGPETRKITVEWHDEMIDHFSEPSDSLVKNWRRKRQTMPGWDTYKSYMDALTELIRSKDPRVIAEVRNW